MKQAFDVEYITASRLNEMLMNIISIQLIDSSVLLSSGLGGWEQTKTHTHNTHTQTHTVFGDAAPHVQGYRSVVTPGRETQLELNIVKLLYSLFIFLYKFIHHFSCFSMWLWTAKVKAHKNRIQNNCV